MMIFPRNVIKAQEIFTDGFQSVYYNTFAPQKHFFRARDRGWFLMGQNLIRDDSDN
jgi:hypothetical protein